MKHFKSIFWVVLRYTLRSHSCGLKYYFLNTFLLDKWRIFYHAGIWPKNEKFICELLLSSIARKFDLLVMKKEKTSPLLFGHITGKSPGCCLWLYFQLCLWWATYPESLGGCGAGKCPQSSSITAPALWASTPTARQSVPKQFPLWGSTEGLLMGREGEKVLAGLTITGWGRKDNFGIQSIFKETQV